MKNVLQPRGQILSEECVSYDTKFCLIISLHNLSYFCLESTHSDMYYTEYSLKVFCESFLMCSSTVAVNI